MDEAKPPIIESVVGSSLSHAEPDFSGYPRQVPMERLSRRMRLLRGFVIGNYWMGALTAAFLGIGILASAFTDDHRHSKDSPGEMFVFVLFFAIFFVIGLVIGSVSKRRRVSVILSTLGSLLSGVIWFSPVGVVWPLPAFGLLALYTGLGLYAAVCINRAARRIEQSLPTDHWRI